MGKSRPAQGWGDSSGAQAPGAQSLAFPTNATCPLSAELRPDVSPALPGVVALKKKKMMRSSAFKCAVV